MISGEFSRVPGEALAFSITRIRQNMADLTAFPERCEQGKWLTVENGGWVGGHWVGLLWQAFALTRDPVFEKAARAWAARLAPRQVDTTTHDLGFLFGLSHVLGYVQTGDETLKAPAIQAAETLTRRFNPHGGFIQAWGPLNGSPEQRGRAIVDTMMNLDLLFWASKTSGDRRYARMAEQHALTVKEHQVRPDFSTAHVIDFDPDSGVFLKQDTHQGLSPASCWSRGQAWAVYGFSGCFEHTRRPVFLQTARSLARYALEHLPPDHVPYWDFNSPDIPDDVRDSSAAAILAAALVRLAGLEKDENEGRAWREAAQGILTSLWAHYTSRETGEPCILLHGTRSKPHGMADHGLIYGDYYFVEALAALQKEMVDG